MIWKNIRTSILLLLLMTIVTGILYPLAVTGIAQALFPWQANGSLIREGEGVRGSALIGQPFSDPKYFWSRPSATLPVPYNAAASGASNLGPLNPALADAVRKNIERLRAADPGNTAPVPVDLVTSSASGLDPHISAAAAFYQIPRISRIRRIGESRLRALVESCTEGRTLGILGETRVRVLELNLALDAIAPDGMQSNTETR